MRTVELTIDDLVILSTYTGYLFVNDFSLVHKKIEDLHKRPVFTHEIPFIQEQTKAKCKSEYDEVITKISKQL